MAVEMKSIEELAARIVREFRPERVILFGSHAYGTPTAQSDVDLLVVLRHEGKGTRKAVEILNAINPTIPVDLLVHTPERLTRRLAQHDFFLQEVMEKGRVLYEASHP